MAANVNDLEAKFDNLAIYGQVLVSISLSLVQHICDFRDFLSLLSVACSRVFLITDNCALLVRRYHLQVDTLPVPDPFLQIVVAGDVTQCSVD